LLWDGTIIGWGQNQFGDLDVPTNLWDVVKISCGPTFNLALRGQPFAPVIRQVSSNQTILRGDSLTLNVISSGTEPLSYQWQKDGIPIDGALCARFRIPYALDSNAGQYSLIVTNDFGAVTSGVITVTVLVPLQIRNLGGGTVVKIPDSAGYTYGQSVTVTAMPTPGWQFLQWLGDANGTNNSTDLLMTDTRHVQPQFGTALAISVTGNGGVRVDPQSALYPFGTVLRVTAEPQDGSFFYAWGDGTMENPMFFVVTNSNPTVSCRFSPLPAGQFSLTVVPNGYGQVTAIPRGNRFNAGQAITLTAWPDEGQSFLGWTGSDAGAGSPLDVILNSNKTIGASFTHRPRLSVDAYLGGMREDGFRLTLTGDFGARYDIESSSDLMQWGPFLSVTNTFGTVQFIDTGAVNYHYRFYRALQNP
jgi:hypothetical protein